MCIVAIAWQLFDDMPLVLLSNRDEFLQRPTEPLHQWPDKPIYAGRDKKSGGTWLGIHQVLSQKAPQEQTLHPTMYEQNGRWAAVLNFRDGVQAGLEERSRGELVTDFLTGVMSPMDFARHIRLQDYAGFNLIIGDTAQAVIVNNRGQAPTALHAGLHVISNGQPEEAWFKTAHLRGRLRQEVLPLISENSNADYWHAAAFAVMSDSRQAPADMLPDTGVATEIEQVLSSVYIKPVALHPTEHHGPTYGTRTQSILTLRAPLHDPKRIAEIISRECEHEISAS